MSKTANNCATAADSFACACSPGTAGTPDSAGSSDSANAEVWIFAYGSLMWRPGFDVAESQRASITGLSRRFCVYSFHHRGTPSRPGLVLGLDRGGSCDGVALKIAAGRSQEVLGYLRAREQVSGVYREALWRASLLDGSGRQVKALAYIVERAHPQYAQNLPLQLQARIIRGAAGISGVNLDYLLSTLAHLRQLGIRENSLERLCALAVPHLSRIAGDSLGSQTRTSAMTKAFMQKPCPVGRLEKSPHMRFAYRRTWTAL